MAACGREYMLPRPDPMQIHRDSEMSDSAERRLADIRRFLPPQEQALVERSLEDLGRDPRLSRAEVDAAVAGALEARPSPEAFCRTLKRELSPLRLSGPVAEAPAQVAVVVPIETAFTEWLSPAARRRHPDARALARALRDGRVAPEEWATEHRLGDEGVLFVVDASALEGAGPSAGRRACLWGPPTESYAIASVPVASLGAPLRVPTAADGVCRPGFELPPDEATRGRTCGGAPEFATEPLRLGAVARFRLAR
jgi:hypothetical protein